MPDGAAPLASEDRRGSSAPAKAQRDERRAHEIGRRARLELTFGYRHGRTVLTHAYAEPPLRVGRLLEVDSIAQLTLVCVGPGVFAGDELTQRIRVERGARVRLVSQSAMQVHPGPAPGPTIIDACYEVAGDGSLECVWDPLIPFAGSRLRQRIDVNLAPGARFFWSEALMAGRAGRGEAWRFDTLDCELRLGIDQELAYLERFAVSPAGTDAAHPWIAADAHYLGTAIAWHDADMQSCAAETQRALAAVDEVRGGVDSPEPSLLVARLLARRGPPFAAARALVHDLLGLVRK
jgi:urease accessory protein UreH